MIGSPISYDYCVLKEVATHEQNTEPSLLVDRSRDRSLGAVDMKLATGAATLSVRPHAARDTCARLGRVTRRGVRRATWRSPIWLPRRGREGWLGADDGEFWWHCARYLGCVVTILTAVLKAWLPSYCRIPYNIMI